MNKYMCYWKGKKVEIESDTSYHAQQLALPVLQKLAGRKKVKSHDIVVVLVEKNGQSVSIDTATI